MIHDTPEGTPESTQAGAGPKERPKRKRKVTFTSGTMSVDIQEVLADPEVQERLEEASRILHPGLEISRRR